MDESLSKLLNITLVIFMVGSLLEMGLKLKLSEAKRATRNVRFLILTLFWSFVLGPAFAVLLTKKSSHYLSPMPWAFWPGTAPVRPSFLN